MSGGAVTYSRNSGGLSAYVSASIDRMTCLPSEIYDFNSRQDYHAVSNMLRYVNKPLTC